MIFVTDDEGATIYASPDWSAHQGPHRASALKDGWLRRVHPEDLARVQTALSQATTTRSAFVLRYRIRYPTGDYRWVVATALPCFGVKREFVGFMGSVIETAAQAAPRLQAEGIDERFMPPTFQTRKTPVSTIDLIADHLFLARALAADAGQESLRQSIEISLHLVGQQLVRN